MWVIVIHSFTHTKTSYLPKNRFFYHVFDSFSLLFPFYTQEWIAPVALRSITLFSKRRERFALVALYKSVMGSICSFPRARCYFALSLTKPAIRLKNQRVNSQPCISVYNWDSFLFRNSSAGRGGQGPGVWGDFWQLLHLRLWNGADKICVHIHHNILPSFR